jgi:hypothetical protein
MLSQVATGAGVAGLASGVVWLIALFRCRVRKESPCLQMRADLNAIIDQHGSEFSDRLLEMARKVENLETLVSGAAVPAIPTGISRNSRSRAMQLLRSGQAPATVASSLSLGARETHLIAVVSRALSTHSNLRDVHGMKEDF